MTGSTKPPRNTGMQLRFVQTGGVGGVKLVAEINTSQLPPSETASIEHLVDAALAEAPPKTETSRVRDDLQYEVHVTRGGTTTSFHASERDLAPNVAALVKRLAERAEPRR